MFTFLLHFGLLVHFLSTQVCARLDTLSTVDEYMDICMDAQNHKKKPGPEPGLLKEFCSPWANRSCCTYSTAEGIHFNPKWLNFDWNHCQALSPQCREKFIMDLCFYECSPNVGPWLVKDSKKIRNERFKDVPLCSKECDRWWYSCENDFTCVKNWAVEFDWSKGVNKCPEGSECKPFNKLFKNSRDFCENLMGGSFKVASDTEDCFYLWFNSGDPNTNERVARKRAAELVGSGVRTSLNFIWVLLALFVSLNVSFLFSII
ncbi:folate receptor beta-like isoform X2 [Biomphalaria glabrata]|nr:folate receptor beta-like isoform X2 [Biomphalaria glabrata]XP_055893376.1 folate receptor beta-like isoform X2 [Biomphalaria glabrata]KAI8757431.1 folate receptor beta-like [Biomphalaria glabrata]